MALLPPAVWPDLFGRALLGRQWGRIGTEGRRQLDLHTPILAPHSMCWRRPPTRNTAAAMEIRIRDQIAVRSSP